MESRQPQPVTERGVDYVRFMLGSHHGDSACGGKFGIACVPYKAMLFYNSKKHSPLTGVSNVGLLNFLSSPVPLALDVPFGYGEDFSTIGRLRAAPDDSEAPTARGDRPEPAQRKTIDSLGRLSTLVLGHGFRDARGLRPAAHGPWTHPGHQRYAPRPSKPPPATSQRLRSSPCPHIMYTST